MKGRGPGFWASRRVGLVIGDTGKENGNYYSILGLYKGVMETTIVLLSLNLLASRDVTFNLTQHNLLGQWVSFLHAVTIQAEILSLTSQPNLHELDDHAW